MSNLIRNTGTYTIDPNKSKYLTLLQTATNCSSGATQLTQPNMNETCMRCTHYNWITIYNVTWCYETQQWNPMQLQWKLIDEMNNLPNHVLKMLCLVCNYRINDAIPSTHCLDNQVQLRKMSIYFKYFVQCEIPLSHHPPAPLSDNSNEKKITFDGLIQSLYVNYSTT